MARCEICGTEFDPLGFQVVVPELGAGFDRVECARQARQFAPAGTPPAVLPLATIAEPVPAYATVGFPLVVEGERRPAFGAAALGLLAAATAATVFVWLRILGADPSSFSLPGSLAPSAVERRTVAAEIVAAPETQGAPAVTRPETASAASSGDGVLAAPASAVAAPAVVGGPLLIATAPTRRSVDETATRTSDARTTARPAGASQHGAGRASAHAGNRVPPGRASGHAHGPGQGKGHSQGHGHGKGKKIGHSKHG